MNHTFNKKVRPARTKSYLKHKLISATAMLLISAIMMVSSSYAWYVLSTAPEVSNIKTQVGANGALEIALLNEESWADLSLLDMGDIDESATDENPISAVTANLTWGNLVNLDDASYGLANIILNPSRLYIEKDGGDYKVNTVLLKTPVYGEDGRVKSLDKTSAVAYTFNNGAFSNPDGYGVRAIGTSATMSVFQLGMNAARSSLVTYSSAARTNASNTLNSTGGDLATIVVDYAVNKKTTGYTETDVARILTLAEGLESALLEIETALRQVFAGYLTTTAAVADGVTAENYQTLLAAVNDETVTLSQLLTTYSGITGVLPGDSTNSVVDGIEEYIAKFNDDKTKVEAAVEGCEEKLTEAGTATYSWDELAAIIRPLVDPDKMTVAGMTVPELKDKVAAGALDDLVSQITGGGGLTVSVPSGSGILSDIADFAGDYSAEVTVAEFSYGEISLKNQKAMMQTETAYIPTHLTASSNSLKAATVAEATGSNSITDYYGYAIDLAFRTNAVESDLLLQTEAANRIYDGDAQNPALQGGGSYMSFTTSAGLSATKMVKLMQGIRVVLMDSDQKILGIAALDCALGKDVYTVLSDTEKAETGMYAYLDGSAGAYQNSDLIDVTAYNALPDVSMVTFNKTTGKVTAKLYMYTYSMTRSSTSTEEEIKYTGGLSLGNIVESGVITALKQDVVQRVTALVYLDGSVVNNATVASNSMHSMTGTLNLQFSSSAELLPADNTQLRNDTSAVSYTELEGLMYQNGYLSYEGVLGKINSGYKIYTGTNDKIYFRDETVEGAAYTELTLENIATVLTPVTVTLSANPASIASTGTSELTATLSDDTLTVTKYEFIRTEGDDTVATAEANNDVLTVTGVGAGTVKYKVTVTVKMGSGDGAATATGAVTSNEVTVTVTENTP